MGIYITDSDSTAERPSTTSRTYASTYYDSPSHSSEFPTSVTSAKPSRDDKVFKIRKLIEAVAIMEELERRSRVQSATLVYLGRPMIPRIISQREAYGCPIYLPGYY